MQAPIRGSINQNDVFQLNGVATAQVQLVAGQYVKIGEFIVGAGLYKSIGYGASVAQSDAQGRIYAKLQTAAPLEQTGKLRISIFSPQDRNLATLGEWPSSSLNQNFTDRTKWIPFPQSLASVGFNYKLVFEFKADPGNAGIVTLANSVIAMDSTEQLTN